MQFDANAVMRPLMGKGGRDGDLIVGPACRAHSGGVANGRSFAVGGYYQGCGYCGAVFKRNADAFFLSVESADRPKSKTPSRTRISTCMAIMISKLALLPIANYDGGI